MSNFDKNNPDVSFDGFYYLAANDSKFPCPCCGEPTKINAVKGAYTCPSCGEEIEVDGIFVKARLADEPVERDEDDDDFDDDEDDD